jgi:oligoribonuclease (3'-5' exoribonuclease)
MDILCQLEEFGLSCFGCCGNNYSNKKKLMRDILRNKKDFQNSKSVSSFISRTKCLRESGVCANVVLKDGKFFCPGHPKLNNGKDYRHLDSDCLKDFMCKTYIIFKTWGNERQKQFLDFIKSKNLDSYTYSIKMDNNSLLEEFEKKYK